MQQTRLQQTRRWLVYGILGLALAFGIVIGQAPQAKQVFDQSVPVLADPGGQSGGAGYS